jgi:hypothetical protein
MVFNATFNNISSTGISWQSVLLVEETGGPGENLDYSNHMVIGFTTTCAISAYRH